MTRDLKAQHPPAIDRTTQLAMAALGAADLDGLRHALRTRAAAIARLTAEPPSEDLAVRLRAAIEAGDELQRDLSALKQRIRFESARLTQLQAAFVTGLRSAPVRRVDYRG